MAFCSQSTVVHGNNLVSMDTKKVKLSTYEFLVPPKYGIKINSSLFPGIKRVGSGQGSSAILIFPFDELLESIPNYKIPLKNDGTPKEYLQILLMFLGSSDISEMEYSASILIRDLWFARGEFEERQVKEHFHPGLFKLEPVPNNTGRWSVTRKNPDIEPAAIDEKNMLVAMCSAYGINVPSCLIKAALEMQNLAISTRILETNLHHKDRILDFIEAKLSDWKND